MQRSFFSKALTELGLDDIRFLKEQRVVERRILEYKQSLPMGEKLSKLISSLANTDGGWIVFGMEEDGATGRPLNLKHLSLERRPLETIDQVAMSMAPPVRVESVSIEDPSCGTVHERHILVTRVEPSDLRPHMAFDSKYYIRGDKGIVPAPHNLVMSMFFAQKDTGARKADVLGDLMYRVKVGVSITRPTVLLSLSIVPSWGRRDLFLVSDTSKREAEFFVERWLRLPRNSVLALVSRHGLMIPSSWSGFQVGLGRFGQFNCAIDYCLFKRDHRADDRTLVLFETDLINTLLDLLRCAGAFYEVCRYYNDISLRFDLETSEATLLFKSVEEKERYDMNIGASYLCPSGTLSWDIETGSPELIGGKPSAVLNGMMREIHLAHRRSDFTECSL